MKITFEGLNEATRFAASQSANLGKKLSVFLVRKGGIKYVVADSAEKVGGKLLNEFGADTAINTVADTQSGELATDTVEESRPQEPVMIIVSEPPAEETKPTRKRSKKEVNE